MASFWSKLNHNLAAIYQDYLDEKRHGKSSRGRFHRPVDVGGRVHLSLRYEGTLAGIEALGFQTFSWSQEGGSASGFVDLENLERFAAHPSVQKLSVGTMPELTLDKTIPDIGANRVWTLASGKFTGYTGEGVIIGIIDSGIDFRHPFFFYDTSPPTTRILRIWDQSLDPKSNERQPGVALLSDPPDCALKTSYGVEYTDVMINDVLKAEMLRKSSDPPPPPPAVNVRHVDSVGHGTHVAAIAAGDGGSKHIYVGVAPRAQLIVVNLMSSCAVTLDPECRYRHTVNYILNTAATLERPDRTPYPVVINQSATGVLSPHDGKEPVELFLNQRFAGARGRAFVVSAGNAAGKRAAKGDRSDNANQHARIQLERGKTLTIPLELRDISTKRPISLDVHDIRPTPPTTPEEDIFQFREPASFHVYYPLGTTLACTVDIPGDRKAAIRAPAPGTPPPRDSPHFNDWKYGFFHDKFGDPPRCNVLVFGIAPDSQFRYPEGIYQVELKLDADKEAHLYCTDVRAGGFRVDDSSPLPSNVDLTESALIGMPGGATSVITVASYDLGSNRLVNETSSRGPLLAWETGPPAPKPDIAAPATSVSALSRNTLPLVWSFLRTYRGTGTSVAAPHVAGTIALMLQKNRDLTSDDIKAVLASTANKSPVPDPFELGAGRLDTFEAVKAVTAKP